MTLVIVNKKVELPQGKKVFRHALVTEGSLLVIDFSNLGGTLNFNVDNGAEVLNLARETASGLGVNVYSKIVTPNVENELNEYQGFDTSNVPSSPAGGFGLNIYNLMSFLSANQGHRFFFSFWINTGATGTARSFVRTVDGDDFTNTAIRMNISNTGNLTTTIAGAIISDIVFRPMPNANQRVCYEYQGVGLPIKVWVNGVYAGESSTSATGFDANNHTLIIGRAEGTTTGNQAIYSLIVEDLTLSGRSGEEVAQKDYDYVNQIGEYEGKPTKRPYANL